MNLEDACSRDVSEIAIVGLAGRFPGADSLEEFWCNLRDGVESISFLSDADLEAAGIDAGLRRDPRYVRAAAAIRGIDLFDAPFFEMSAREAQMTDPQHRLFLECAWHALENAGCDPRRYAGTIGVFAGAGRNTYFLRNIFGNEEVGDTLDDYQVIIASDNDYLATRVAFKLHLTGPAVTIQTACSTSLVAVHMACRSLLGGECDIALAGGVSIRVPQQAGYLYKDSSTSSPDGHTRPFDVRARGGVFGSGVGVAVLKPLKTAIANGDRIRAVIKGSAINNDGGSKVGFTAPSASGQATAIRNALAAAGVDPLTINYVEAHGTGTSKGDPIEIAGIKLALGGGRTSETPCAIGSVKGNVGHLDAAAGITGLIKAVLALENEALPGTVNFEQPNPACGLEAGPFVVNSRLAAWKRGGRPRRAGVTSLGFGGTNAHVVVEEAPPSPVSPKSSRRWHLLVVSAKTVGALERSTANLAGYLRRNPQVDLANVAFTLQTGRAEFAVRRVAVCESVADAVAALESPDPERTKTTSSARSGRPLTFLFAGCGLPDPKSLRRLYDIEPAWRHTLDTACDQLTREVGSDYREAWLEAESASKGAAVRDERSDRQLTIFLTCYALAQLWKEWGVEPEAVAGYEIGEIVAGVVAGVIPLGDAVRMTLERSRTIQQLPSTMMVAVALGEKQVRPLLTDGLDLHAVHGPGQTIVSGTALQIEEFKHRLADLRVSFKSFDAPQGYHSHRIGPKIAGYRETTAAVKFRATEIRFVSAGTGQYATHDELISPDYWASEPSSTVDFSQVIETLAADEDRIFLEVGPNQFLSELVRLHPSISKNHIVLSSSADVLDARSLLETLGQLWLAGQPVRWKQLYSDGQPARISLPPYPFERQRHWIEKRSGSEQGTNAGFPSQSKAGALARATPPPEEARLSPFSANEQQFAVSGDIGQQVADLWRQMLGIEQLPMDADFLEVGGDSLVAVQMIARIRDLFMVDLPMTEFLKSPTVIAMAESIARLQTQTRDIQRFEDVVSQG